MASNKPAKRATSAVATTQDWGGTGFERQGFEGQTKDDLVIPILSIAHSLSKVVQEELIPGIKVGALYNTVTEEMYKPPVIFVPCATAHFFTEQVADGTRTGSRLQDHLPESPVVQAAMKRLELAQKADSKIPYGQFVTEEGNDLVEKFLMYGMRLEDVEATVPAEIIVISFRSFAIRYYKRLNTALSNRPTGPPLFSNRVAVSTFPDSNNAGKKFPSFLFKPAIGESWAESSLPLPKPGEVHPLLIEGRAIRDLVQKGAATAATEPSDLDPANAVHASVNTDRNDDSELPF